MIIRLSYRVIPCPGGMEQHVAELTKIQREDTRVVQVFRRGDLLSLDDIQLSAFDYFSRWKAMDKMLFSILASFKIYRILRKHQAQSIIHVHGDIEMFFAVLFCKYFIFTKVKSIYVTFHNDITIGKKLYLSLRRIIVNSSNNIINVNYLSHAWIGESSIFYPSPIPDSFVTTRNKIKDSIKRIICVSSIKEEKNLDMLIALATSLPQYEFVHYGYGDPSLLYTKSDLGNIEFNGLQKREVIYNELRQSDVLVHFASYEGTPSAIIEAASLGLPIICSNVSGLEKVFIGGYFCEVRNLVDYVEALEYLKFKDVREQVSLKLHEEWSEYKWRIVYEKRLKHLFV